MTGDAGDRRVSRRIESSTEKAQGGQWPLLATDPSSPAAARRARHDPENEDRPDATRRACRIQGPALHPYDGAKAASTGLPRRRYSHADGAPMREAVPPPFGGIRRRWLEHDERGMTKGQARHPRGAEPVRELPGRQDTAVLWAASPDKPKLHLDHSERSVSLVLEPARSGNRRVPVRRTPPRAVPRSPSLRTGRSSRCHARLMTRPRSPSLSVLLVRGHGRGGRRRRRRRR
jgi:hypothetical protein